MHFTYCDVRLPTFPHSTTWPHWPWKSENLLVFRVESSFLETNANLIRTDACYLHHYSGTQFIVNLSNSSSLPPLPFFLICSSVLSIQILFFVSSLDSDSYRSSDSHFGSSQHMQFIKNGYTSIWLIIIFSSNFYPITDFYPKSFYIGWREYFLILVRHRPFWCNSESRTKEAASLFNKRS